MTPQEYIKREQEIQEAVKAYPEERNLSVAYKLWKEARGEEVVHLSTGDQTIEVAKRVLREAAWKLCEKCGGKAILEAVCGGCVEGKKGYKSKFTCEECLHRELSKKDYTEWLKELALSSRESSSPSV